VAGLGLAACSSTAEAPLPDDVLAPPPSYTVGGTASGLSGAQLILQNNGGDNLAVSSNGAFTFPTTLITGNSYNVTVLTQPTGPNQTCAVTNGSGIVGESNISGITVLCVNKTTATDTIGGYASGVLGSGLVLQNNGADSLAVASNGAFTFATPLPAGLPYNVTVVSPPINPYQNCIVSNGAGTTGGDNVTNVSVSCTTNVNPAYTIGGTVTGVSASAPLVLQNNGRDNLTLAADGPFTFSLPIPSGSVYAVTSLGTTGQQSQTCTFTNASGTVASADITNITIACTPNVPVSVMVSGLAGTGLVLQDNGGDNLSVTKNGTATFGTALASGAAYAVTVLTQPSNPTQNCVVAKGSGKAAAPAVTGITVTCTTIGYTLGGTVAGLNGAGLVLQDNGGNNLAIAANGAFAFPMSLPGGTPYNVTVLTQPANLSQTCSVNNSYGSITNANVTNIQVTCVTNSYTVGGTESGLPAGVGSVVLLDNGGDATTVPGTGGNVLFTFPTALLSGSAYAVTVQSAPAGYYCAVGNAAGTVTNANVATVLVTCAEIGGFAYVTNGTDNTLSGFVIDYNSGALLALSTTATGTQPSSVVSGCEPDYAIGTLYVANQGANTLSAFSVNQDTGALALITTPPIGTGTAPDFVDFSLDVGCVAIALNGSSNSASTYLAGATGALTAAASSPFATSTQPAAANNMYFGTSGVTAEYIVNEGANDVSAYSLDTTTGALTLITGVTAPITNPVPAGTTPVAIASEFADVAGVSTQFVYVVNQGANSISEYQAGTVTGAITAILDANYNPILAATGNAPTAITIVDDSNAIYYVYVANGTDNTISSYTINLTAAGGTIGQLLPTGLAPTPTGTHPVAMTSTTMNGTAYYLFVVNGGSNSVSVFSIDLATGALTALPSGPFATGVAPNSIALQFLPEG
jgi:6-phosphogluconolactonase (cycloisomerase 2 family)